MYPELSVNLGNLLLSLSDALDLATPSLAFHQQRTAFISWELCKQAGFEKETLERVFLAALLHDIGALSLEEKIAVHNNETTNTEAHCIKGELLFEDIPWLEKASKIVRHHHTKWKEWGESIDIPAVLESQIVSLADTIERKIDRKKFILLQNEELLKYAREISGKEINQEVVDLFFEVSKREEFWFDLTSPRLYSLLLHNGPYRKVEIDLPNIGIITRLFKNIIDFKSNFTATHSSGVAECAACLSRIFGFTEIETELMEIAGYLHDLGKLVVPNSILDKAGRLTKEEFSVIKQHTYFTFSILITINGLQQISEWAAYHHEKLDGTGYPFRKTSNELNIGSRIMAVADIFTALAEDRPYREGMQNAKIAGILKDLTKNGALDGRIVNNLLENISEVKSSVKRKQEEARDSYNRKFGNLSAYSIIS